MELICLFALFGCWSRLLVRLGFRVWPALVPSLVLSLISWTLIVQLVGIALSSSLLTLATLVLFLVLGLLWPGHRLVRLAEHQKRTFR
jgi:hypothetical protein